MVIIGIDPGTATTGWGVIKIQNNNEKSKGKTNGQSVSLIGFGCIVTDSNEEMGQRLKVLHKSLKKVIKEHNPDCIIIEQLFFGANSTSALSVGQARGVILLAAREFGVDVVEYTGLQVKLTVAGHGRANKKVIQTAVRKHLGTRVLPKPKDQTGKEVFRFRDDAYDAVAAALCHGIKINKISG